MEYTYHSLDEPFEKDVLEFCFQVWRKKLDFSFQVLDEEEFIKVSGKRPDGTHSTKRVKKDFFGFTEIEETLHVVRLRAKDWGFHEKTLWHEIIHAYRPNATEKQVLGADDLLAVGFNIWRALPPELRWEFVDTFLQPVFLTPEELKCMEAM